MISKTQREGKSEEDELEHLTQYPFPCPNCLQLTDGLSLFCSELCKQECKTVRYARACKKDDRDKDEKVKEAIKIRIAHILGGGYPEKERLLPKSLKDKVLNRDKGLCQKCGDKGTEIDHIKGSSDDIGNLQLLCTTCHKYKTASNFIPVTIEDDFDAWLKAQELQARIELDRPIKLADNENKWKTIWREIASKRRQFINQTGSKIIAPGKQKTISLILSMKENGQTYKKISEKLNESDIRTFSGKETWTRGIVKYVFLNYSKIKTQQSHGLG